MILWTIQPLEIYELIMKNGVYRCDFDKCSMPEFQRQYDWLSDQMRKRIGGNPNSQYPVWAWYINAGKRKKPDLRRERYGYGTKGQKYVCMEIVIPDEEVVLSDFDAWNIILSNELISDTEKEDSRIEKYYESLPDKDQETYLLSNWDRVFDISPLDNGWNRRGVYVQATFWELKKESIRRVYGFTCA